MSCKEDIKRAQRAIRHSIASLGTARNQDNALVSSTLPDLPSGLTDIFSTLLSSLKHTVTSLSLAFKPPVTHEAASQQLDKLADLFARITSCVFASGLDPRWSVLAEEWTYGVQGLGGDLERLLVAFTESSSIDHVSSSSSSTDNQYLSHTGMVWDAIDKLAGFSTGENAAVVRKWDGQREVVNDAWAEFKDFLEDQAGEQEGSDDEQEGEDALGDDEDHDEWGELEKAMKGGNLSAEERRRAEAAKQLLGLQHVLHATIPRYLPLLMTSPDTSYRSLLDASAAFVAAFDSAIASMYPEQDVTGIKDAMKELAASSTRLVDQARSRLVLGGLDPSGEAKRAQCLTFLDRWAARLILEQAAWDEQAISMAGMKDSLPT